MIEQTYFVIFHWVSRSWYSSFITSSSSTCPSNIVQVCFNIWIVYAKETFISCSSNSNKKKSNVVVKLRNLKLVLRNKFTRSWLLVWRSFSWSSSCKWSFSFWSCDVSSWNFWIFPSITWRNEIFDSTRDQDQEEIAIMKDCFLHSLPFCQLSSSLLKRWHGLVLIPCPKINLFEITIKRTNLISPPKVFLLSQHHKFYLNGNLYYLIGKKLLKLNSLFADK